MNFKLPLIAAFVAMTSFTACGGGSDPDPVLPDSPATLTKVDVGPLGTGAEAVAPKTVTVYYSGFLYSSTAPGNKGAHFQTLNTGAGFPFQLGANKVIAGFEEGVIGMKVGGKRTVMIPAAKGYGAVAKPGIPANSGLVFDLELRAVQ